MAKPPGQPISRGAADLATTAVTASPAGNYPITVTDAGNLAAPNYDFPTADFKSGTLTVTAGRGDGGSGLDAAQLDVRAVGELHGDGQRWRPDAARERSSSWWTGPTWARRSRSPAAAPPARARRSWTRATARSWPSIRAIPTMRPTPAATPRLSTRRP